MAPRKDKPTPKKRASNPARFTLDDIERAIKGVERAGLVVRGVEITATGSIKIECMRDTKVADAASPEATERQDEVQPTKKRV
jgi:hypothetical protein